MALWRLSHIRRCGQDLANYYAGRFGHGLETSSWGGGSGGSGAGGGGLDEEIIVVVARGGRLRFAQLPRWVTIWLSNGQTSIAGFGLDAEERCMTVACQQQRYNAAMPGIERQLNRDLGRAAAFVATEGALTAATGGLSALRWARFCGCFVEGTQVATPEGLRAIEDIAVGDLVMAWNPETGETTTQTVTALIRPEPKLIWRLEARDAGGETEIFEVTDDHPWYVEGAGWVETRALRAGQRIETADDRGLTILDIARTDRVERTYNLEVSSPHTFLVGEDGAVVHNQTLCARAAALAASLGRNRVTIRTGNRIFAYDLRGASHFERTLGTRVATPHVRVGTVHTGPGGQSIVWGPVRSMTEADFRIVNRYLGN